MDSLVSFVDLTKINYVVINHCEPDHSGSLSRLLELAPHINVICTKAAQKMIRNLLNYEAKIAIIGDGDTIDLGNRTLKFFTAPFLHWPETMFTYLVEDKILFSCDAFGSHFCDSRMYNDMVGDFWDDFEHYYKVIMRPFGKHVRKAVSKVRDLKVEIIAPSHGPILPSQPQKYIHAYEKWSSSSGHTDVKKFLVFYVSGYGNTERMAEAIAQGIETTGAAAEIIDLSQNDLSDIENRVESAAGIFVGSPTINGDSVKPIWELLARFITIDVKEKLGACFGSYGWNSEAVPKLDERLRSFRFKVLEAGLAVQLVPSEEDLTSCREFGARLVSSLE